MIRWDVKPMLHTVTHPVTGETSHYSAQRVSYPEGFILGSEFERAKRAGIRRLNSNEEGTIVATPIYTNDGSPGRSNSIAYVVVYRA